MLQQWWKQAYPVLLLIKIWMIFLTELATLSHICLKKKDSCFHAIKAYWGYGVRPVFLRLLTHENVMWSYICTNPFYTHLHQKKSCYKLRWDRDLSQLNLPSLRKCPWKWTCLRSLPAVIHKIHCLTEPEWESICFSLQPTHSL